MCRMGDVEDGQAGVDCLRVVRLEGIYVGLDIYGCRLLSTSSAVEEKAEIGTTWYYTVRYVWYLVRNGTVPDTVS